METDEASKVYLDLTIDIQASLVRLGGIELHDQWIDFYALLALASSVASDIRISVSAEELARVGPWRHKAAASVGKEVARHLTWLARQGLAHAVSSRWRTKAWKLDIPTECVYFRPGRAEVAAWVVGRSSWTTAEETWIDDLEGLVEATGALQRGRAESALERVARPLTYKDEPALEAWSALLVGRASYQHENHDLLLDQYERWFRRTDAVGKTVGARLRALMAYRNRYEDAAGALVSLRRLAADLELSGDIGALAAVLNVMGILVMRMEDPRAGVALHLRAAALFGIVGDYPSLQAALFNLANCCRRARLQEQLPPDEAVFRIVELCRSICECFGVGADSAQAEVSAARWAFEMGDFPRARRYLAHAETIVRTIESSSDQACYLMIRAELEHADPKGIHNPLRDLQTAERLFRDVHDERSAAEVQRLIKQFRGGRPRA